MKSSIACEKRPKKRAASAMVNGSMLDLGRTGIPMSSPPAEATRPRVLVADDDATLRLLMREALETAGFAVV